MMTYAFSSVLSCKTLSVDHSPNRVIVESAGRHPFPGWIRSVAFSGDNTLLVGGCLASDVDPKGPCGRGVIQVWDRNKPKPETLSFPKTVTTLAALAAGREWIAGDEDGRLISSLHRNAPRPFHQRGEITALAFSPDGKWVVSGSVDPSFPLGFMDRATGGVVKVKKDFDPVSALAFSPDGRDLAVGSMNGELHVWEYASPRSDSYEIKQSGKVGAITGVAFSPDGQLLAYGTSGGDVRILERNSWQVLVKVDGASAVKVLAFSPDNQHLAIGHDNGKVILLDSEQASVVWTKRHVLPILDLAYSSDGKSLAVAIAEGSVFMYRIGGTEKNGFTNSANNRGRSNASAFP